MGLVHIETRRRLVRMPEDLQLPPYQILCGMQYHTMPQQGAEAVLWELVKDVSQITCEACRAELVRQALEKC